MMLNNMTNTQEAIDAHIREQFKDFGQDAGRKILSMQNKSIEQLHSAHVPPSAEGDGVSVALKYIRNKVEEYDREYARQDYETGAWEFGSNAQEEYSNSMHELIEEIENLEPTYTTPQPSPDAAARISELEAKIVRLNETVESYSFRYHAQKDDKLFVLKQRDKLADALNKMITLCEVANERCLNQIGIGLIDLIGISNAKQAIIDVRDRKVD